MSSSDSNVSEANYHFPVINYTLLHTILHTDCNVKENVIAPPLPNYQVSTGDSTVHTVNFPNMFIHAQSIV